MENNNKEEAHYFEARKRVEEIKRFYEHLTCYIVVNIGLLFLNLVIFPNHLSFYWPLLGWGIGVLIHGMKVFNWMPFLGKEWEEQKNKEFMEKEMNKPKTDNFK